MKKRFRLLDWKTRWFIVYIFYRKQYGEAAWSIETFRPSAKDRERGFFIERPNRWGWGWEDEPERGGQLEFYEPVTREESNDLLAEIQ